MRAYECILLVHCIVDNFVSGGVLNNELYRLDIVHYNDFHARFEETSVRYPECTTNNTDCLGGFARLYQGIQILLKEKPDALLLNAGDTFQGTYWYTLLKWNITQKFINMLPNDAHAIGNHEFDDGTAGLAPYLAALRAPVLAANIDTSREPSLKGLYKPHIIVERKGRKIGIIGLITPETKLSSNPQDVIFLNPIEIVYKEAQLLTDKGVDIIIVLSHCGLKVDKKIAKEVGENIDVIVGGHSHSLLWNGDAPSKEPISGPYPVVIETESKPGHKVLVVTASAFTKYLGNITAYFDRKGDLQSYNGEPLFLNRSILEDPEILKLMQPYKKKLQTLVQEVIGYTANSLLEKPCGYHECAIGDIIADSFLNATKKLNTSNLTHVAFFPRNMIRGAIAKGEITRGSIINALPFTNLVSTFTLRGEYLVEVFRKCLSNSWSVKPFEGPWMPQVAGLRLNINITDKDHIDIDVLVKEDDFKPIDVDKDYQVTTFDFVIRPGKGFDMLTENARNVHPVGKDTDLVEPYIRALSPITSVLDNRLNILQT